MGTSDGAPSDRLVAQRIRNRIIEYLELAASYAAQEEYQRVAPINVPNEVINQWEDWVPTDPRTDTRPLDSLSAEELDALRRFQPVWEVAANALEDHFPVLDEVQGLEEWDQLRREAGRALTVFAQRGRLPDDHEVPD